MDTTRNYTANGDVVSSNADAFWQRIEPQLRDLPAGGTLELDLRAARMIDSVGLNAIVRVIRAAKERGGSVRARVGSESVKRLCRFTRLDQHAEIVGP